MVVVFCLLQAMSCSLFGDVILQARDVGLFKVNQSVSNATI